MSTIAAAVLDVVAESPPCLTMRDVVNALPDADRAQVESAVHRLTEKGVLRIHHQLAIGYLYSVASGATRPTDGRGRPRKSEQVNAPA